MKCENCSSTDIEILEQTQAKKPISIFLVVFNFLAIISIFLAFSIMLEIKDQYKETLSDENYINEYINFFKYIEVLDLIKTWILISVIVAVALLIINILRPCKIKTIHMVYCKKCTYYTKLKKTYQKKTEYTVSDKSHPQYLWKGIDYSFIVKPDEKENEKQGE